VVGTSRDKAHGKSGHRWENIRMDLRETRWEVVD
jgi:hypothetical protein